VVKKVKKHITTEDTEVTEMNINEITGIVDSAMTVHSERVTKNWPAY